jgi:uncharacterized protein YjbI with pentapeptide repeats
MTDETRRRAPRWWMPGIAVLSSVIVVTAISVSAHRRSVMTERADRAERLADLTFARTAYDRPGAVRSFRYLGLADASLPGIQLDGADLRDTDLDRADLSDASMVGADLSGVHLRQAKIARADLSGASAASALLGGIDGYRLIASNADFQDADLGRGYFAEATFKGANLTRAILPLAVFSNATLAGANLQSADLRGVVFDGADLSGANLSGANIDGAVFTDADLTGANLSGVCWKSLPIWPSDLAEIPTETVDIEDARCAPPRGED